MPERQPPIADIQSVQAAPYDYQDMLMNAPIGIFTSTPEGRFVYANSALARIFGYDSPRELIEATGDIGTQLYADPADRDEILRLVKENDERLSHECRFVRRDGSQFWASYHVRAVRGEKGDITYYQGFLTDITERKRERESLLKTQFAMDRAPDSIFWVDGDGRIVYANDRACASMGYAREELLAMKVFDIDPDFPPDGWEEHKEKMRRRGTMFFESRHRAKDGRLFPVEVSTNHFDFGDLYLDCAFDRDITERRQAEAAVKESEARFRMLFKMAPLPMAHISLDGRILDLNNSLIEMMGYTINDVPTLKQAWDISMPDPDIRTRVTVGWRTDLERAIAQGADMEPFECPLLLKDGTTHTMVIGTKLITDSIIVSFFDITDRKRTEEALEKRVMALTRPLDAAEGIAFEDLFNLSDLQRLQDLFAEAWGVGALITRPDGTPITQPSNFTYLCGEFIRKSEKGFRKCQISDAMLGRYDPSGPVIRTCLSAGLWGAGASISVGGRHIANWLIGQVRNEAQSEERIRDYAREIGVDEAAFCDAFLKVPVMSQEKFEQIARSLFSLANQLSTTAYQNIQQARFIAERKQSEAEREKLEAQLLQSQKLEAIGILAGGVAHDFNNMLGAITGYAELTLDKMGPEDPFRKNLEKILDAGRRSANLTRQLLAFARKQTIKPIVLDLNEAVEAILRMIRRLIGENVELTWLPGTNPCTVKMDTSQLDQVLINLSVNARDAIGDVGRLTIETAIVSLDETCRGAHAYFVPGEYVLLAVSDDGCGMDRETLDHIFEPFFTTKGVGRGTGMGLATVYGIVKQNQGFINVYSEPGKGTTFRIYIPQHVGSIMEAKTAIPEDIPLSRGETILIVEDDPTLLEMSTMLLQQLGYTVIPAATPTDAIRIAQQTHPEIHLLITDVIMPGMNGRDLASRLLTIRPKMKRLFMSGYTANVIAHQGVLDKGIHFIQKPFSVKDIAAKVREVLG